MLTPADTSNNPIAFKIHPNTCFYDYYLLKLNTTFQLSQKTDNVYFEKHNSTIQSLAKHRLPAKLIKTMVFSNFKRNLDSINKR